MLHNNTAVTVEACIVTVTILYTEERSYMCLAVCYYIVFNDQGIFMVDLYTSGPYRYGTGTLCSK